MSRKVWQRIYKKAPQFKLVSGSESSFSGGVSFKFCEEAVEAWITVSVRPYEKRFAQGIRSRLVFEVIWFIRRAPVHYCDSFCIN